MNQPQQQAPPAPPLQPVPSRLSADVVTMSDGQTMVTLKIDDVTGTKVIFMTSEFAAGLGQILIDVSKHAGLGLLIARNFTPTPG